MLLICVFRRGALFGPGAFRPTPERLTLDPSCHNTSRQALFTCSLPWVLHGASHDLSGAILYYKCNHTSSCFFNSPPPDKGLKAYTGSAPTWCFVMTLYCHWIHPQKTNQKNTHLAKARWDIYCNAPKSPAPRSPTAASDLMFTCPSSLQPADPGPTKPRPPTPTAPNAPPTARRHRNRRWSARAREASTAPRRTPAPWPARVSHAD